jgi:phage shock protein A
MAKKEMDPRQAYDAVLDKKARGYRELKLAVAGILYLRNKIEGQIREGRAEVARIHDQIRRALEIGDEASALDLVRTKQALANEIARAERDLEDVAREGEDAKLRFIDAREEIRALERERTRAVCALQGARARARMGEALCSITEEGGARELDTARQEIARIVSEQTLERELSGGVLEARILAATSLDQGTGAGDTARRELEAIKERYRSALARRFALSL